MTQPSRVIYLPPGVVPAPTGQSPTPPSGIPFDRSFFQQILPGSIASFGENTTCSQPIVELLTTDGTSHYVKGIVGVADNWVALHTQRKDHAEAVEVFLPYQTIFRVEIHPCGDQDRTLGFLVGQPKLELPAAALETELPTPAAQTKRASSKKK